MNTATIVHWDSASFANQLLRDDGTELTDAPVRFEDALTLRAGNIVALLPVGDTHIILGRLVTPPPTTVEARA